MKIWWLIRWGRLRRLMPTCFEIQPFDGGKYDKRFADIYVPAIEAAELTPYRVDKDPNVDVPVESIEDRTTLITQNDLPSDLDDRHGPDQALTQRSEQIRARSRRKDEPCG